MQIDVSFSMLKVRQSQLELGCLARILLTRPLVVSTRMAFFCRSTRNWPATVGMISFGGAWRRPGPSFSGFLGCDGMSEASISSPGRTYIGPPEDIAPARSVSRVDSLFVGWSQ